MKSIKVEHLSKVYQLGNIGTGTLSYDLERYWARIRGKEDPLLRIGEQNDSTLQSTNNVVFSLKNINFEIEQGDVVGIIGRNGAGKSTLLKILSRITSPSLGTVKIKGRVTSLLEIGTGFHPELTGRENVYLNGAILGMRKMEIRQQFDEIVAFSGVGQYIDTPVKRYSSGMYVRLAFAVAAHLKSEIMIVDEVLAVGDAEFQQKCLGKLNELSNQQGRTVLFVSHNMGAIRNLCQRTIVLDRGTIVSQGTVHQGIMAYTRLRTAADTSSYRSGAPEKKIREITVEDKEQQVRKEFEFDETVSFRVKFNIEQKHLSATIGIKVLDQLDRCVFTSEKRIRELTSKTGESSALITIPANILTPNAYKVSFAMHFPNIELIESVSEIIHFEVLETGTDFYHFNGADYGCVFVDCKWNIL